MAVLRSRAIYSIQIRKSLTWTYGVTLDGINSYDVWSFMVFPKDF